MVDDTIIVTQKNPKSLYKCCVDYIASKLNMIESLVGFPEIVGKDIFKAARDVNCEDLLCFKTSNTRKCIQIFFEAYGDGDILKSLSLKKSHVFFNDIIDDCWYLFQHLAHLDLSSCGIGDNHDFVTFLNEMIRLQTLVLRDNLLTDEGIRKLTAKSRMHKRSTSSLKFLDLSENYGITVKSASFLRYLPHLVLLNVSCTSLTFKDTVLLDDWQINTGQDVCNCMTSCFLVSTQGWAADLLNIWKNQTEALETKSIMLAKSSSAATRFYSRTKSRMVTKTSNTHPAHESHNKKCALVLKSHLFSCDHSQPCISISRSSCVTSLNQRMVTSQRAFTHKTSQINQMKSCESMTISTFSDCETSILSQYGCSPPKKKMKRVSLLQQLENFS